MRGLEERELNPLKVLHHVDRLRALAAGEEVAPVTVEVDPVAYCNHACGWCVDPVHEKVQMAPATFRRLMAELAGLQVGGFGVEGIVLKGGGEPTLHPRFGDMVEWAAGEGFAVGVVTNGSRLLRWGRRLAAAAAYVRVSVDGPTPESHRRIHRSRDFPAVLEGVRLLLAERGGRRHPVVGLSFAMDIHVAELADEAVGLGARLGVDYVLLRPPFFEEVGRRPTMSIEEARRVRLHLRQAAGRHQGSMKVLVGEWVGDAEERAAEAAQGRSSVGAPQFAPSGRRDHRPGPGRPIEHRTGRCPASPLLAVVTADGSLYGCCNLRALPEWSFGRLDYEAGRGFAQLWWSRERHSILERMHRTECIRHCTHPLARYNEMIEVLRDGERPHSQFV